MGIDLGVERTLNPYMDIVLRLLSLAGVFVSFGEGVCKSTCQRRITARITPPKGPTQIARTQSKQRVISAEANCSHSIV